MWCGEMAGAVREGTSGSEATEGDYSKERGYQRAGEAYLLAALTLVWVPLTF